jgi:hypothetical protein
VEVKTADRLLGLLLGRFENIEDKKRFLRSLGNLKEENSLAARRDEIPG